MSVVLPNSVFFHIGRTGGHWVSHVLWRAGLIQDRLYPLHLTPAQANAGGALSPKPASFCFVRHPVSWLASLWLHEMEFGWGQSGVGAAASDHFPTFVERMLATFPKGPCSHAMAPYVDHCSFVGRTESLSSDLGQALNHAGEAFDPALLAIPPINESAIPKLRVAAKAPAALLERVMAAESAFCERFDYQGVPEKFVADSVEPVWPLIRARADDGACDKALQFDLVQPRFDYHLDDGGVIASKGHERATQWALTQAVEGLAPGSTCAVVSESDPYFAYLAGDHGCSPVTFVNSADAATSAPLLGRLAGEVTTQPLETFLKSSEPTLDALVFCDSLEISIAAEMELIHAALVLKPGGQLVFTAPILHAPVSVRTLWGLNASGRKLSYYSLPYIDTLLANLGFSQVEIVRTIFEVPSEEHASEAHALADALGTDRDRLLGKAIIRARRQDAGPSAISREDLVKLWLLRRPVDFMHTPTDGLPIAAQATIAMLKAQLAEERQKRTQAQQGMADREQELIKTRVNLAALANDADYSRQQIGLARGEAAAALQQLHALRNQIEHMGVEALQASRPAPEDGPAQPVPPEA